MNFIFSFGLTLLFLTSCHSTPNLPEGGGLESFGKASSRGEWEGLSYNSTHNLFFSAQPKINQLKAAREKSKIDIVINLRKPLEMNKFNERKAIEKLGMRYYNIPLDKNKNIDSISIELIERAVQQHIKFQRILIYDSTGDRSGAWYASHLYTVHNYRNIEEIIGIAMEFGLKSKVWKAKTQKFLLELSRQN